MAKYEVQFSCGHTSTVDLVGKHSDRERKIKWFTECGNCPECYKAIKETEREEKRKKNNIANKAAAEENKADGWPQLEGTEKQILWAEKIRRDFFNKYSRMRPDGKDYLLSKITLATEWIENRDNLKEHTTKYAKLFFKREEELANGLDYDSNIYIRVPENQTKGIAEIEINGETIKTYYQIDYDFNKIVKSLGYSWEGVWVRELSQFNGDIIDRAAELGNKLLLNGFGIKCKNVNVLNKSEKATYKPEIKKWIKAKNTGNYSGWLILDFPRNDELYKSAEKLPHSRHDSGRIVVKPDYYREVLDFAEIFEFEISAAANKLIEKYKSAEVVNAVVPTKRIEKDRLGDILKQGDDIIDELKD